jgi:ORMDL family
MQAGHGAIGSSFGQEWLNGPAAWMAYTAVIVSGRLVFGLIPGSRDFHAWTCVNIFHAIITFFLFHWVKGNPFPTYWAYTPPSSEQRTFWEQIDRRWQNTPSRKFCTAIVIGVYLLAAASTPPSHPFLHIMNFAAFLVAFIAKLPAMDSVRLFGINGDN